MIVRESIQNFERNGDPISRLGVGLKIKRNFDGVKELLDWLYMFPVVCTQGSYQSWEEYKMQRRMEKDKVYIVKWIKDEITINDQPLGLYEAKNIYDALEYRVNKQFESINFERGGDPLRRMGVGIGPRLDYQKAKEEINATLIELSQKYGIKNRKPDVHLDVDAPPLHYAYSASIWIKGAVLWIGWYDAIKGYEAGIEINLNLEEHEVVETIEKAKDWIIGKIENYGRTGTY